MGLDKKNIIVIIVIVLELVVGFIFYPAWLALPTSRLVHYLIVSGLFVMISVFIVLLIYVNRQFRIKQDEKKLPDSETEKPDDDNLDKLEIKAKGRTITKYFIYGGFFVYSVFLLIIKFPTLVSEFRIFGDEGFHVFRVVLMEKMITAGGLIPTWVISIVFYMVIALVITFVIIVKRKQKFKEKLKNFIEKRRRLLFWGSIVIVISIIAAYTVLFDLLSLKAGFQAAEGNINIAFARYGPLNPIMGLIFLITFGYSEFTLHIISLLFSLFTMIYLYKLIRKYRSDYFAIFISVLVPLLPTVYDFSGQYYLATGVLFFSTACFYYFHLAISKSDTSAMNKFLLVYITGFLYKKVLLFALGAIYVYLAGYLIIKYVKSKKIQWREIKLWGVYLVLALIPSLTWIFLTDSVVWRKFEFSFSNLFSSHFIDYAKIFPQMMSFIWLFILVGIPLSLFLMRDHLTYSSVTFSIIIYLIYTAESSWEVEEPRFMITVLPLVLICSLQIFDYLLTKGNKILLNYKPNIKKRLKQYLPVIWMLISVGFVIPLTIEGIKNDNISLETRVPFDETALFLAENLTSTDSIAMLVGSNPIAFYAEKYDISCEMYILREVSSESYLIEYMTNTSCNYFAVPDYDIVFNMISSETYDSLFSETSFYLYHTITSIYEENILILALS